MLHNSLQNSEDSSMEDSSYEGASPPDWSQLSSFWQDNDLEQTKSYPDFMDFTDHSSFPMDMKFHPAMSIEPSALHFDPMRFDTSYQYGIRSPPNEFLAPQFPFSFQSSYDTNLSSLDSSPQLSNQGRRRLSITSSSSTGASFSSVSDSNSAAEAPPYPADPAQIEAGNQLSTQTDNPMAKLAERVRQSAGVMLALPMAAQIQAQMNHQTGMSNILPLKLNLPTRQSSH
jgi:hypothetical protein